MRPPAVLPLLLSPLLVLSAAAGQFALQTSGTTASLRGISAVDGRVAWASGSGGTIIRTVDGGEHWQACTTPPDASRLDFRGIQAFDEKTAVVMSSGKGDLSRIYRTVDGCATWRLVLSNPDAPEGFFDALYFPKREEGWLLGDPVGGSFYLAGTHDGGLSWTRTVSAGLHASGEAGAFAASNQSLTITHAGPLFGGGGGMLYRGAWERCSDSVQYNDPAICASHIRFRGSSIGLGGTDASAGIFAVQWSSVAVVAVGGDYRQPTLRAGTASFSLDDGATWQPATEPPAGYRSSVAYDAASAAWIATGPTGTDVSRDNGRTWKPLLPDTAHGDTPDAAKDWNALGLPFVVGPRGRVGRLRPDALKR